MATRSALLTPKVRKAPQRASTWRRKPARFSVVRPGAPMAGAETSPDSSMARREVGRLARSAGAMGCLQQAGTHRFDVTAHEVFGPHRIALGDCRNIGAMMAAIGFAALRRQRGLAQLAPGLLAAHGVEGVEQREQQAVM